MTRREKIKEFFKRHKSDFIAVVIGLLAGGIGGAVAYGKAKSEANAMIGNSSFWKLVEDGAALNSMVMESYEKNQEVSYSADFEDKNGLIYEYDVKVKTECIGD